MPSTEMIAVVFVPKAIAIPVCPTHRKTLSDSVYVLHIGEEMIVRFTLASVRLNAMDAWVQVMPIVTSACHLPLEMKRVYVCVMMVIRERHAPQ